jgi:hypothetical protein
LKCDDETIETIDDIVRKNAAATPIVSKTSIDRFSFSNLQTSNDPDGMPPFRVALCQGMS